MCDSFSRSSYDLIQMMFDKKTITTIIVTKRNYKSIGKRRRNLSWFEFFPSYLYQSIVEKLQVRPKRLGTSQTPWHMIYNNWCEPGKQYVRKRKWINQKHRSIIAMLDIEKVHCWSIVVFICRKSPILLLLLLLLFYLLFLFILPVHILLLIFKYITS